MSYSSKYYTSGNAARKYYEEPEYERKEYVVPSKRPNRRVHVSPFYGIMVIGAIMVMAFVAVGYVSLQSQVTNLRKEKGQLSNQYENMKLANDLYYEEMISKIDLKEIERIAVEELGMKMAGEGQVMTYSNDFDDYVIQYADIPE